MVSEKTFFSRYYSYDKPDTVIEMFHHPYKVVLSGQLMWFHLHANRAYCYDKVKKVKLKHPELFVLPEKFFKNELSGGFKTKWIRK